MHADVRISSCDASRIPHYGFNDTDNKTRPTINVALTIRLVDRSLLCENNSIVSVLQDSKMRFDAYGMQAGEHYDCALN